MALSRSITALITDGTGHATTEFLAKFPEEWAREHIQRRYGAAPPTEDDPDGHIVRLCFNFLVEEYRALRSWFTDDGKLSNLLQGRFLDQMSGPIGAGIGWDFKPNGDPEPRMLQFKGTLISCARSAELIPPHQRNSGAIQLGGIVRLVRGAYTARAELHNWKSQMRMEKDEEGRQREVVVVDGERLAQRWVAFRTHTFMIGLGADPMWSWDASRCRQIFGSVDEQ